MSKYAEIETTIRSEKYLNEALLLLGYKPEIHQEPQPLEGYLGDRRAELAHVIIRRQQIGGSSNDVGFRRQPDGTYRAIVSEFDKRTHPELLGLVSQRYAEVRTIAQAKNKGYKLASREQTADGKIRLVFGVR